MRLDVVTLAPEAFLPLKNLGVIGRAFAAGIAELHTHNPRDHTTDRYRKVDDEPYGGGAGMVLKPEPVFAAVESIPTLPGRRVLLMSPQGQPLRQADLRRWADQHDQLVLLCGHYEGFDERIRSLADGQEEFGLTVVGRYEAEARSVAVHIEIPYAGRDVTAEDEGLVACNRGVRIDCRKIDQISARKACALEIGDRVGKIG